MVDREMLSAISDLLDKKLDQRLQPLCDRLDRVEQDIKTLKKDVHYIKVVQLENDVMPRLSTIESCYLDTFQRYKEGTEQIDSMADDIKVLKLTVSEHGKKLAQMSV